MELDEILEAKLELQHNIQKLIKEFTVRTGLSVSGISIDDIDLGKYSGEKITLIARVDVEVKLP